MDDGVQFPRSRLDDRENRTGFWRSHIGVGFAIMLAEAVAADVYLATSSGPRRPLLLLIASAMAAAGAVGWRLAAWVANTPGRSLFATSWSIFATATLGVCAALDGGIESPFLFLAALPVVYAGLLLSPRAVGVCGGVAAATYVAVGLLDTDVEISQQSLLMLSTTLGGLTALAFAGAVYRSRSDAQRDGLIARLGDLSMRDALTGCWNHHTFSERLAIEFERAVRYERPLSLMVCDVDLFKSYNDTYGHDRGDSALAALGATLRAAVRSTDIVARIGGDEFAVVMPETTVADASRVAGSVASSEAFSGGAEPTLSIGIAELSPGIATVDELFQAADAAMYVAKSSGRSRFVAANDLPGEDDAPEVTADGRRYAEIVRRERRRRIETETILDTALDEAPVGFAFIDPEFRILRANRTVVSLDEIPLNSAVTTLADAIPEIWPFLEPHIRQVLHDGLPVHNLEVLEPTGITRLANLYPVRVADRLIGVGMFLVDISDRKRVEHAQEVLTGAVVGALASASEARDPYTAGHQRRVAMIATAMATALGYDPWTVKGIALAAGIHDVGKLAVPAEILARPGRLNDAERLLIQGHPRAGYDIVSGIEFPWPVADMILQHHERLDGTGYPAGLHGDQINVGAQIIAVADVVEAMTAHRPYRPALGIEAGLNMVRGGRGNLFDPHAVDTCVDLFREGSIELGEEMHT